MKLKKYLVTSVISLIIIIIASNLLLYKLISDDYTQKIDELTLSVNALEDSLTQTESSLTDIIYTEKANSAYQRDILKQEHTQNIQSLQSYFEDKTDNLKDSLEEQLGDVESGLKSDIAELDVSGSDFTDVIEDTIKSVVSVKTSTGQGSGVIVSNDGIVITNRHVVAGSIIQYLVDYEGNIIRNITYLGAAADADLAVIKINDPYLDALDLADSDDVTVGSRVIAIGNPLGLGFSVTEGIVSGTDRVIDSTKIGYVQTDVPINPGNSGGPLISTQGEIIGINTFKITDTEGLGFAIPAEVVESIVEQATS